MNAVLPPPATSPAASAADQPLLRLQNVESAYGPIKAIRGVSLQVRRGEIAAVLGSNGAGKTTILKTISGIIDPRKGSIEFQGADITANDPAAIVRRGLMHVPEGREVFPLLSVRDNLLMGAYTRADKDAVARDIETVFGYFPILKERAAQDAGLLSGGQQQMLAISRALMANPELILLVEQNANMALNASDYGYVLENGRIVMEDSCERLREKDDIKEFYLGMKDEGVRGERRWKKKKTWR